MRTSVTDAMRTLRADLAAAARDARTEAREFGRSVKADATTTEAGGQAQLQRAELMLNSFRAEIRSDLRKHLTRADLTEATVDALRDGLTAVQKAVRESLKG